MNVSLPSAGGDSPLELRSVWCQYNKCLQGRWVPRQPPFANLKDLQEEFLWFSQCPVQNETETQGQSEEEIQARKSQRLVDMMNYVWQPNRGKQVQWDPEEFIVRLLQTPAGVIFIGDSITSGWEHGFNALLSKGSGERIHFDPIPVHVSGEITKGIKCSILRPNHPKTLELQKRAGVPDSRMKRPVFSKIMEHMLLQPPVIREITENRGAQKDFRWVLNLQRVPGWEDFLQNLTTPNADEAGTVDGDSIVVMNTGAHWSRGTLHMLPNRNSVDEEHRVLKQMTIMVERLNQLRRVKIMYRATNAAHPDCSNKKHPYQDFADAVEHESDMAQQFKDSTNNPRERKVRLRWDWDMFDTLNDLWREEIRRLGEEREILKKEGRLEAELPPAWRFLDVWGMTLQRPDAHSDCLHWCLPTMYNEWSRHLLHILHLESGLE
ncbi:hypothetical protein BKA70DRAFT_1179842 [Coprinopsis sp. MPI-PUGE-AT-0042]|nr:hypothetical protein BKA70DRAFT_1179842 [Coprinopsis sp. MPI-PUGE-AT-0042]